MDNTAAVPALVIAAQVRTGQRTAREVVDEYLDRIAAEDPAIGAFQVVCADAARGEADALTGRPDLAALPLAGVPVAIKDNVDVAGLPTRHGSAATAADPATADDELVRRLRAAGAVIVGKTRLPELAIWGFTESRAHGGTRNPHDPGRNAGGSTGGGAAAVAAGLVPLALGSDGGGSLRIPAANCGVVGVKPGRGVVPLARGAVEHWCGLTEFGPVAANVGDAALALAVLSGDAGTTATGATATGATAGAGGWTPPQAPDGPLRIAVSLRSPSPIARPGRAARAAVTRAAELARAAGHEVVTADPPYPLTLVNSWVRRWLAGVATEAEELGLAPERLEPRTRTVVRKGQRLRRRGQPRPIDAQSWRDRVVDWFTGVDVLLSPVIADPAPKAGWATDIGYLRAYLNGARTTPYTQAWNLAGLPALSLPVPVPGHGTPGAAVQLVTGPGGEPTLLRLATQLEAAAAVPAADRR